MFTSKGKCIMDKKIDQVRLSSLFTDPALKAAFERAERDNGAALVVPAPRDPQLTGGSALEIA